MKLEGNVQKRLVVVVALLCGAVAFGTSGKVCQNVTYDPNYVLNNCTGTSSSCQGLCIKRELGEYYSTHCVAGSGNCLETFATKRWLIRSKPCAGNAATGACECPANVGWSDPYNFTFTLRTCE